MSRESVIKTVAGALSPDKLDLSQFQRRSTRDPRQVNVRGDVAAAALAFAASDRQIVNKDGTSDTAYGDPLATLLLRLKYAGEKDRQPVFEEAHQMLLERNIAFLRTAEDLEILYAVAIVALFEWLNDPCRVCRMPKARARRPRPCPCVGTEQLHGNDNEGGRRENVDRFNSEGKRISAKAFLRGPKPGCPSCKGLGRIYGAEKKSRGTWCVTCRNSGRAYFKHRDRLHFVNDFLVSMGHQGIEVPEPLADRQFRDEWLPTYRAILDSMRATDKAIATGIDFGFAPSQNRRTEPPSAQEQYAASSAPPEAAHGEDAAENPSRE